MHFHCLQKLLLPFTFPSKKISASSNKHHIFIIYVYTQDLKVSDNFACPKSLFPIWKKYFGSFAKIAPYLTSYSTKVQIDISYLMATLLQNKKTIQHNWKIKILNLKSYLFYGFVSLVTTIMKLSPFFIIPGNLPNKKKRFL